MEDVETGQKISGVQIELHHSSEGFMWDTETGPNGLFIFPNTPAGSYHLEFYRSGYENERDPGSGSLNVSCDDTEDRGTIEMQPN